MNKWELDFLRAQTFEWDAGNSHKNWLKHHVDSRECEEVFLNKPLLVAIDERHSQNEVRYYALGMSNQGRKLFLCFTVRGHRVRVISARNQNRKERVYYEA